MVQRLYLLLVLVATSFRPTHSFPPTSFLPTTNDPTTMNAIQQQQQHLQPPRRLAEPEPESESEPKPETTPETKPEPEAEPEAEAEAEAEPFPESPPSVLKVASFATHTLLWSIAFALLTVVSFGFILFFLINKEAEFRSFSLNSVQLLLVFVLGLSRLVTFTTGNLKLSCPPPPTKQNSWFTTHPFFLLLSLAPHPCVLPSSPFPDPDPYNINDPTRPYFPIIFYGFAFPAINGLVSLNIMFNTVLRMCCSKQTRIDLFRPFRFCN